MKWRKKSGLSESAGAISPLLSFLYFLYFLRFPHFIHVERFQP